MAKDRRRSSDRCPKCGKTWEELGIKGQARGAHVTHCKGNTRKDPEIPASSNSPTQLEQTQVKELNDTLQNLPFAKDMQNSIAWLNNTVKSISEGLEAVSEQNRELGSLIKDMFQKQQSNSEGSNHDFSPPAEQPQDSVGIDKASERRRQLASQLGVTPQAPQETEQPRINQPKQVAQPQNPQPQNPEGAQDDNPTWLRGLQATALALREIRGLAGSNNEGAQATASPAEGVMDVFGNMLKSILSYETAMRKNWNEDRKQMIEEIRLGLGMAGRSKSTRVHEVEE